MVAFKWFAWRSKPYVHVYSAASPIHGGNNGTNGPHISVIRVTRFIPNTKGFCICMEWWKFLAGSDAEASGTKGEEKIRVAACTSYSAARSLFG